MSEGSREGRRGWGGARAGAGRKPKSWRQGPPHRSRERFDTLRCLHVTMRVAPGRPSLREPRAVARLRELLPGLVARPGFSIAAWTLQWNHCHLIVEADDDRVFQTEMRGFVIVVARALNRLWGRKGRVFGGRFHSRVVKTTFKVRQLLRYVLLNHKKHGMSGHCAVDPASSGMWFDGWLEPVARPAGPAPVAEPRSWLLQVGWRRHGLISVYEQPGKGRITSVDIVPRSELGPRAGRDPILKRAHIG